MDFQKKWYVKGFRRLNNGKVLKNPPKDADKFCVCITDTFVTKSLLVTVAKKRNGMWMLTLVGGETLTLKPDSNQPRELLYGRIVFNYKRDILRGDTYDLIPLEQFEQVSIEIANGSSIYQLVGQVPGTDKEIVTSNLTKLWKDPDDGRLHAFTRSGTHYVF